MKKLDRPLPLRPYLEDVSIQLGLPGVMAEGSRIDRYRFLVNAMRSLDAAAARCGYKTQGFRFTFAAEFGLVVFDCSSGNDNFRGEIPFKLQGTSGRKLARKFLRFLEDRKNRAP